MLADLILPSKTLPSPFVVESPLMVHPGLANLLTTTDISDEPRVPTAITLIVSCVLAWTMAMAAPYGLWINISMASSMNISVWLVGPTKFVHVVRTWNSINLDGKG